MPLVTKRTQKAERAPEERTRQWLYGLITLLVLLAGFTYLSFYSNLFSYEYRSEAAGDSVFIPLPKLDKAAYDGRLLALAHLATSSPAAIRWLAAMNATTSVATSTGKLPLWPMKTVYPEAGAILPFHRVVAYYGNFYSAQMGVLGEYPPDQVLAMLASTTAVWAAADPSTPVIPAIQYIAVVAQGAAGKDGKYRARMPDEEIDKALAMADEIHGLLILDVQVGKSDLPAELPLLKRYLAMPQVELAIDPEFSMKYGNPPGTVIGTYDASDVNYAADYLASLVDEYHLPPKVLIVHRFTEDMVTNYRNIHPLPEVEIVMDMDGWGSQAKKKGTYNAVIYSEPVQFTGIKLFYKNDLRPPSTGLLTPAQVLDLTPSPIYVQYQ
ncbi:MAG TPA: hypothetical protein VMV50_03385 [Candidatus Paceibacterota bacterium]|nr:hypothetical protein [Candidatus Paceibacterota bacterium]